MAETKERTKEEQLAYNQAMSPRQLAVDRHLSFHGTVYYPFHTEGPERGKRRYYDVNNYTYDALTARMKRINDRKAREAEVHAERQKRQEMLRSATNTATESASGVPIDVVKQMIQDALNQERAKTALMLQELNEKPDAETSTEGEGTGTGTGTTPPTTPAKTVTIQKP